MGYLDMMKSAIGLGSNEPKEIDQDGKHYTFTPGKNGSLIAQGTNEEKPLFQDKPSVAKTVTNPTVQVAAVRD